MRLQPFFRGEAMPKRPFVPSPLASVLAAIAAFVAIVPAGAQQPSADFPDGPGKQTFVNLCGACHDINRVRIG
jgi:hypothetical protein